MNSTPTSSSHQDELTKEQRRTQSKAMQKHSPTLPIHRHHYEHVYVLCIMFELIETSDLGHDPFYLEGSGGG